MIKISSNTKLAHSFSEYVDFDTGPIVEGTETVESLGESLLEQVIAYASGTKKTKAVVRDEMISCLGNAACHCKWLNS